MTSDIQETLHEKALDVLYPPKAKLEKQALDKLERCVNILSATEIQETASWEMAAKILAAQNLCQKAAYELGETYHAVVKEIEDK